MINDPVRQAALRNNANEKDKFGGGAGFSRSGYLGPLLYSRVHRGGLAAYFVSFWPVWKAL